MSDRVMKTSYMKDSIDLESIFIRYRNGFELHNAESNEYYFSTEQEGDINRGFVSLLDIYSCKGINDSDNESIESYIFDLVVDEKVEIKVGDKITKGIDALCYLGVDLLQVPSGCISEISYEAIKLSIIKNFDNKESIFEDLYKYNSRPLNFNIDSILKEVLVSFKDPEFK